MPAPGARCLYAPEDVELICPANDDGFYERCVDAGVVKKVISSEVAVELGQRGYCTQLRTTEVVEWLDGQEYVHRPEQVAKIVACTAVQALHPELFDVLQQS